MARQTPSGKETLPEAILEQLPWKQRNYLRRYVVFRYSPISIFSGFEIVAVRNIRYRQEIVVFRHAYRKKIPKPYNNNTRTSPNSHKRTIPSNQNNSPS